MSTPPTTSQLLAALSPKPLQLPRPTLAQCAGSAAYLVTQINLIFIFLAIFQRLEEETETTDPKVSSSYSSFSADSPQTILLSTSLIALLSYLLPSSPTPKPSPLPFLLTSFYLTVTLRGLSPVISTLTASYASDTIYRLSLTLLLLHLLLHDYSAPKGDGGVKSLKAGLFATVLLASRIAIGGERSGTAEDRSAANFKCFAFVFSSTSIFCFSPPLRKSLPPLSSSLLALLSSALSLSLTSRDPRLLLFCAVAQGTAGGVGPVWQWRNGGEKEVLCGRWDIKHLKVNDRY